MHNLFTFAEEHAAACGEILQMPEEPAEQVVERNYLVEFWNVWSEQNAR